jgi:hypothetical protein
LDRSRSVGDRCARVGRRARGLYFKTSVERLEPRCMLSVQGLAQTAFTTVMLANPSGASPATTGSSSPPSAAYTPTEILNAYGFSQVTFSNGAIQGNGAGQTIALIDANNDPNITADLATFDTAFNLPAPPSFVIEGQTGTSQLPSTPAVGSANDWSLEISLDVEWAHALAPDANILLVEANSSNLSDLFAGATTAAKTPGVVVVSMSFGSSEASIGSSQELAFDSTFTTPSGHLGGAATTGGSELPGGVTFVASAGDTGSPGGYPAYSPNVLSVGGTTLNLSAGNYSSETVWDNNSTTSATGGGISKFESQPVFQEGIVPSADSNGGLNRAMPDVAFDGNPNTGVAVSDSFDYGNGTSWVQVGGTSFGTPAWAAIVAIADQGRAINGLGSLNGTSQTLPDIYSMPSTNFHDITSGTNGTFSAAVGYDLVTGRGTPMVALVVGSLDAFSVTSTSPAVGSTVHGTPTSFVVTFSDAYSISGLVASDFEVNGIAATSFSETSSTSITFTFSTSPVLTSQLTQTMTIAAGAIVSASDGTALTAFSGTFNDDALPQIAVVSTTPPSGSSVVLPMTSLTVQFNEAYSAGSISTSNLTLSQGTVTGFTLVNSTTVTYSLSGLTTAGTLTVTIAAGAIDDTNGGGGTAFTGTYILTTGLLSQIPAGSLVYQATAGGTIATGGASQSYTLDVAAGQTITAVVDPVAPVGMNALSNAQFSLTGPGITGSDTVTATSLHQEVVLQTVAATGGTYTFTVSSSNRFRTGSFQIIVFLNAAESTSAIGGASNNQRSSAQSINGSFVAIGPTASRGAVVGLTNGLSNGSLSDYYSFTLTAGQTVSLAVTDQTAATGTINVSLLNSSGTTLANGTPLTTNVDGAIENFTAPSTGTYYAKVTGVNSGINYVLVVTRGADFDLKDNGAEATAQNITGTAGVLGAIVAATPADWYAVNLTAGAGLTLQTYTFGTTAGPEQLIDSVQPQIQLYSPSGTLIASGSGGPNQTIVADAATSGTYFVEVTGGSGSSGEYFLGTSIDALAPAVSITPISPSPTNAAVSQMQIVFNEAVSGMSLADVSLSFDGGPNLLTSAQTLTTSDNKTFTLNNLAALTAGDGTYTLSVAANSGITDQNGFSLLSGTSTTFTVDTTPPEVTGVYVSGTAWSQTFLNYLASQGLGSAQLGYLIPAGANQLQELPWVNLTTISVVFNENVSINSADSALQLIGSPDVPAPAALSSAAFTYSVATHTAQWTFSSPLATDKFLLSIPSADVTDSFGSTLDGEWTTSSSAYPSGNGAAGGDFNFRFNVVQADVTQDGVVTGLDGNGVRLKLLQNTTTSGYSPFYDVIGSGAITGADGSYVRLNLEDRLPATDPSIPGGGSGDAMTAAIPSGTTGSAAPSTSLANGNTAGGETSFAGASTATALSFGALPSALQLVALPPTGGTPSNVPSHAASSPIAVTDSVVSAPALEIVVIAAPVQFTPVQFTPVPFAPASSRPIAEAVATTTAEQLESPRSALPRGIEIFATSIEQHSGGRIGDSDGDFNGDPSVDPNSDFNRSDELPADGSLADLILEQELDWLDG